MNPVLSKPAFKGGLLALLAACLFGVSTPLVQRFGAGLGPFSTAAMLYAGAAFVAWWLRKPAEKEAQLQRSDMPRLLAMASLGAVVGPVALAWGLQRTSGSSASLMLTMEALFTALLAWRLYGEEMSLKVTLAMLMLLSGGLVLVFDQGLAGQASVLGLLAVIVATAAWGIDNALSRGVAERDPGQVVFVKCSLGSTATLALALAWGEPLPSWRVILTLFAVGATGYGLSLRFYLLAQRSFGASRAGSVFGFAPFVGAAGAFLLGDRSISLLVVFAAFLMLCGVVLHLIETHEHEHAHGYTEHEHTHTHADGHHTHAHGAKPEQPHSHMHKHEPLEHSHPHVPDLDHQHRH